MNVYVIGSLTTTPRIEALGHKFLEEGNNVIIVTESEEALQTSIERCFDIIQNWADLIVAVPKQPFPDCIIGEGTLYEIEFAKACGKTVLLDMDSKGVE